MAETVLLLDGQTIQALPVAESLKKSGYSAVLFCSAKNSYGYHTKYADRKILCPEVTKDETEFYDFLRRYLSEHKTDVIIPMNDDSATFLSKYKPQLSELSNFIMPDYEIFSQAYDKNKLMDLCMDGGFPHPQTFDLERSSAENIKNSSIFPAIIKPNLTSGGRGMKVVNSFEEFMEAYPDIRENYGPCHLQKFIKQGGKQIKVQLFVAKNGELVCSSVIHKQRYYPENGGSSCCNETIKDDKLVGICYAVLEKIGWYGFADFDMIEDPDDGVIKIMEINPRIPACIKSAVKSGIDYGTVIADATLGKSLKKYEYSPGKTLRYIGFEMLWFMNSRQRFKTNPNWFKFFGRNLYFQDFNIRDPKPFIFGTLGNIKKQLSPEFRKSKSGMR
ncbi:MAG: ATP-grasp domain-containing protein [Rikenellaceae bacterium]|nr:ATP-grasp domain-containing protein [Rikenellaceae bacterium]